MWIYKNKSPKISSYLLKILELFLRFVRLAAKNDKTALHIAAEKDSIKMGELLISKGADINAKDIIYQITLNYF